MTEQTACKSCPCREETPSTCVCDCFGCKFHCSACWCRGCSIRIPKGARISPYNGPPPGFDLPEPISNREQARPNRRVVCPGCGMSTWDEGFGCLLPGCENYAVLDEQNQDEVPDGE